MARKISVITPTHNRRKSLQRLLDCLSRQDYPMSDIEVVVVCDNCKDDSVLFLSGWKAPFSLKYIEQPGLGAGNARNVGASIATGEQLVFLDDDIEPSEGLLRAYAQAVAGPDHVVVGYLPMELKKDADFHQILLTRWWEKKYRMMGQAGYRHNYEDLLSGNFSIMAAKFREVGGFNARFRCREDYELGYRLARSGAIFRFCAEAWGFHKDEVTDKNRLNGRKIQEGYWDVEFSKLHPELTPGLRLGKMRHPNRILQTELFLAFHLPFLSDLFAEFSRRMMKLFQALHLRRLYRLYDDRLHSYWYIRGVRDNVKTREKLNEILKLVPRLPNDVEDDIDIGLGMAAVDEELKRMKVMSVNVFLHGIKVATIRSWPGAETLRAEHLRLYLADRYMKETYEALVIDQTCES